MIKKKKSRLALDGMAWGGLGNIFLNPLAQKVRMV
jgi:hypothetical protein